MTLLGTLSLSADELRIACRILDPQAGKTIAPMRGADYAAEGEWRWANDRDAFVAERERMNARIAAQQAAERERLENRLRNLTWEQLLTEKPFEQWSPSPPYPSEAFRQEAREVVNKTCRALQTLGDKPRKADVRRLLRECVEWFNRANEQAGGVIETGEREDICAVLEEMASVARHRSLVDEVDQWRDW
jgi:hypothetical protein